MGKATGRGNPPECGMCDVGRPQGFPGCRRVQLPHIPNRPRPSVPRRAAQCQRGGQAASRLRGGARDAISAVSPSERRITDGPDLLLCAAVHSDDESDRRQNAGCSATRAAVFRGRTKGRDDELHGVRGSQKHSGDGRVTTQTDCTGKTSSPLCRQVLTQRPVELA